MKKTMSRAILSLEAAATGMMGGMECDEVVGPNVEYEEWGDKQPSIKLFSDLG